MKLLGAQLITIVVLGLAVFAPPARQLSIIAVLSRARPARAD